MGVSFQLLWVYRPPTPFCLKDCFTPVNFYKRPPLVSAFSNWKTLGEEFYFSGKRWKAKCWSRVLQRAAVQVVGTPAVREAAPRAPRRQNCTQRLTIGPPRPGTVSEHLGLISVYFVHLRAGRVPSSSIVHLAAFQFMRAFLGTLQDSKRALCI